MIPLLLRPPEPELAVDRILVAGNSARTLELLRLATIRSDDVVLVAPDPDAALRRFANRFAIEIRERRAEATDVGEASAVLMAIGDIEAENDLIRMARRKGVPVHVADRDLVSDFGLIEFLERRPSASLVPGTAAHIFPICAAVRPCNSRQSLG